MASCPALIITVVVIGLQRLSAVWTLRNKKFEEVIQGGIGTMVEEGCLQLDVMEAGALSQERLFARLRSEAIENLGTIKRVYMEANGEFTILQQPEPQPGLTLIPNWDQDFAQAQRKVPGTFACGNLAPKNRSACKRCGQTKWTNAVISSEE